MKGRPEYDRAIFEVLHAIRDLTSKEVAAKTYVSAKTIDNWRRGWRNGGTRYPQHHTLAAVAAVVGLEYKLTSIERRPRRPLQIEARASD